MSRPLLMIVCLAVVSGAAVAQDFVPFVIPAEPAANSEIRLQTPPISGAADRLVAHDGHFYRGGQRVRLWGVNLSFAANFPTKEDAPKVARRLAAAGVNTVRCHHMDTADWPRGLWDPANRPKIHPEALDRLDFFINELARNGVYVNINLHVGHAHSRDLGLPEPNREYDKIVGIFTPALIDAQKRFAAEILSRHNPYRRMKYADDPAVALVEITNEDSLFMWGAEETLRTLPEYYANLLQGRFSEWLKAQYGTTASLAAAWNKDAQPLGESLLVNGDFSRADQAGAAPMRWTLEQHGECKAQASLADHRNRKGAQAVISRKDDTDWHIQFSQGGFAVEKGRYYTVSFDAAAAAERPISCAVAQAHEPWSNLGLSRSFRLKPDWQSFRTGFTAADSDANARISFTLGADMAAVYLANVRLQPGGRTGLAKDESIDKANIALFAESEVRVRSIDRMRFLAQTEKTYFDSMRDFVKKDLACKALVTGTIVFGPLGLYAQSDMDFIDSHSYWHHPEFPGRAWDAGNWLVEQAPMVDHPDQSPLFRMAAERLAAKPFTVTEYNHPAPMDSQVECVPLLASFGAAQDWDGLWIYSYSHSNNEWGADRFDNFFDIHANPAKWGFMPVGAILFRDLGVAPRTMPQYIELTTKEDVLGPLAEAHMAHGLNMSAVVAANAGVTWQKTLENRLLLRLGEPVQTRGPEVYEFSMVDWKVKDGKGAYGSIGKTGLMCVGAAQSFAEVTRNDIVVEKPGFAAVAMFGLGDLPFRKAERLFITACGRCENVGMGFSPDRRTVGTKWGQPPAQIEAVTATVRLPPVPWQCYALKPDGSRGQSVPVMVAEKQTTVRLSPQYGTMWYLLVRSQK